MTIRAVLFDVGGVLVHDRQAPLHRAWERRLGLAYGTLGDAVFSTPANARALIGQATQADIWQDVAQRYGLSAQERDEFAEAFFGESVWEVELLEYVRALRPRFKTAVISDAWRETREAIRDHVNDDVFDVIVYSAEEGICKPHPEIYTRALARLGVEPREAIFVDDRLKNVEGALKLGIHAFLYTDPAGVRREIERLIQEFAD